MRNKRNLIGSIGIFALLILLASSSGCVQRKIVIQDLEAQKIIDGIFRAIGENESLSAVAQIDLVTSRGHHPVKAVVILKRPSYLRLEIFSPLGPPDYYLAASPDNMRVFVPSRGEYYQCEPTAENLARFMPWPFDVKDIVMILTGAFPFTDDSGLSYRSYQNENYLQIEIKTKTGYAQIIKMGESNRLIKFVQNDKYGRELYHVKYEAYQPKSRVAGIITVNMADGVSSIRVKYSELKIEESDDLSIFDLPLPDGVKPILLK